MLERSSLPAFEKRLNSGKFHMFWVLLEQCNWHEISLLSLIQSIGNPKEAIDECQTKSDEQCRLIEVAKSIEGLISSNSRQILML